MDFSQMSTFAHAKKSTQRDNRLRRDIERNEQTTGVFVTAFM